MSEDSGVNGGNPSVEGDGDGAPPADWLSGLPDDLKGLAEVKGWKEPGDALKSYQHLESTFGADRAGRALIMPKDGEDKEAFDSIYKALGRPEDAAGYELAKALEGEAVDENFMGLMSAAMHEAGLSKAQAAGLARAYQSHYNEVLAAAESQYAAVVEEARREIPPADQEMARRGLRAAGADAETIMRLEQALGPAKAVELFKAVGALAGEDPGVSGAAPASSSAAGAQAKIAELKADQLFSKRYLDGEPAAVARMTELYKQASQGRKPDVL